jgi:hypothetical protein
MSVQEHGGPADGRPGEGEDDARAGGQGARLQAQVADNSKFFTLFFKGLVA